MRLKNDKTEIGKVIQARTNARFCQVLNTYDLTVLQLLQCVVDRHEEGVEGLW